MINALETVKQSPTFKVPFYIHEAIGRYCGTNRLECYRCQVKQICIAMDPELTAYVLDRFNYLSRLKKRLDPLGFVFKNLGVVDWTLI